MTIRISASERLTRRPAKIFGSAAGNTTVARNLVFDSRMLLVVSTTVSSSVCAPSMVLSRTGQMIPKMIVASCMGVPSGNSTMNTGSIAGGGIDRRKFSVGER